MKSMEKIGGLVLDVRDDYDGQVLRQIWASDAELPELIKSAMPITPELDARLPDDRFALVLIDDNVVLRKFACVDAGGTALSVEYFLHTGHRLPEEAQKVAAANLMTACGWFGIEPPADLEKVAMGVGSLINLGLTAPGMARQAKMNLAATEGAGHMVVTPAQRQAMLKGAEAAGTHVMPMNGPTTPALSAKTVVRKVAGSGFIGDHGIEAGKVVAPDDNMGKSIAAEQPPRLPQATALRPHVNVAGKNAPGITILKKAESYALPSLGMYPLDRYDQVKAAAQYFSEWSARMSPEHRREYSQNLLKRANALHIAVTEDIEKYASDTYAPDAEISASIDARRNLLVDDIEIATLDKIAEARPKLTPDMFALVLNQFDKVAGLERLYDRNIPDHLASTFGLQKLAADSIAVGNDHMTVPQLRRFAKVGLTTIKFRFGHELADRFARDPVAAFNSLPLDQKKVMMRMATDNGAVDGEIVT